MRPVLVTAASLGMVVALVPGAGVAGAHAKQHRHRVVVYLSSDNHGRGHLFRARPGNVRRPAALRVPPNTGVDAARLSPDGQRIALLVFNFTPRADWLLGIAVADRNGRHMQVLARDRSDNFLFDPPSWSPDGSMLYFSRSESSWPANHGPDQIYSVKVRSSHPKVHRVVGGRGLSDAVVSPNGKRLAAIRPMYDDQGFSTTTTLVTLSLNTGKVSAPLLSDPNPGTARVPLLEPAWSTDGSRIAVVRVTTKPTGKANETSEIDAVKADGTRRGKPRVLVSGGKQYFVQWPVWRNRHQLWYSRNVERQADLFSVTLHGSKTGAPVRRTHTQQVGELSASFGG